ncbi:MAG: hypothetical protein WAZ76_19530, partial [Blautia wexlerae]
VLIQYQPDGFTSNLAGLKKYNTFPGNNVTCDSWKEVANSLLPAVNSNFIFAAYVDQAFPVSDTFATDKTFFENYSRYQKPVFLFLICPLSSRQVKYLKVSDKNTYISFWSVGIFMHTISLYIF